MNFGHKTPFISQQTGEALAALSFLFTSFVCLIHMGGCVLVPYGTHEAVIRNGLMMTFYIGALRLAVPFFFALSGFFAVKGFERISLGTWWESVNKRILSLVVPWIMWNVIYYAFRLLTGKYSIPQTPEQWVEASKLILGWSINEPMACGQFWYLRVLMVYIFFMPLIIIMVKGKSRGILFIAFLILVKCFNPCDLPSPLDFGNLVFFSVGVYLGFNREVFRIVDCILKGMVARGLVFFYSAIVVGCVLISVSNQQAPSALCKTIYLFPGLMLFMVYRNTFRCALQWLKPFYRYSFFIYGVHVIIASQALALIRCLHASALVDFVAVLIAWPFVFALSLAVGLCLDRCAPRLYLVLSGGRSRRLCNGSGRN